MLDQIDTTASHDPARDDDSTRDDARVCDSVRRLFERLNPPQRDPNIASDAPLLAVYDWEIAMDTDLALHAVRSALQHLDGKEIVVGTVNEEHSVTALAA